MQTTRTWDIFCKVIDNFGDIGVCWRLSCDLAQRGQQVRLWVDDASALAWMAPGGVPGVQVRAWTDAAPAIGIDIPADVVIEAFGCEINAAWIAPFSIAAYASIHRPGGQLDTLNPVSPPSSNRQPPVWINLEYLSAEPYVASSHGLPSPVMSGPARGMMKWFFYPGFTVGTGGLLRGAQVAQRPAPPSLHATESIPVSASAPALPPGISTLIHPLKISLFCYEPLTLEPLLEQLAHAPQPTELLVTAGRATQAVQQLITHKNSLQPLWNERKQLSIAYQSLMPQSQFDDLLWHCDLNFVRGEDSLVRALWAGKAFVWQIYPQSDSAHAAKLNAFLDWLQAPPDLRLCHLVWNGLSPATLPAVNIPAWTSVARAARERLLQQTDLTSQLMTFVQSK
jgi:uncharacterized repeat protein (TIGR03837 family)